MSMEMKLNQKLLQQMVMTPQLQMAIKLLQVSRMELLEQVGEELKENPMLEDSIDASAEVNRDDQQVRDERNMTGETEAPAVAERPEHDREVPSDGQTAADVDWET